MTPEEKLLALIQQEKKPAETKAEPSKAAVAETVVAAAAPAPVAAAVPAPAPAAPVKPASAVPAAEATEKKLKLASPAPVTPAPAVVATPAAPPATPPVVTEAAPSPAGDTPPAVGKPEVAAPGSEFRRSLSRPGRSSVLVVFNRVLAGVILVLLVLVVYSVASIREDVAGEGKRMKEGAGIQPVMVAMAPREQAPPVEVFLEKVDRNVFLPTEAVAGTTTVAVLQGRVADLKLIGVSIDSASDQESMAIIKDKVNSKTLFVKKGEQVGDTGYTLERVLNDRVVLKMRKQEIELQ